MTNVHLTHVPVFDVALIVMDELTGPPAPVCVRWFGTGAKIDARAKAVTLYRGPKVAVCLERPVTPRMLTHELYHATQHITRWCGVDNEECEAHLAGWLARWAWQRIGQTEVQQ